MKTIGKSITALVLLPASVFAGNLVNVSGAGKRAA